ncbi:MAG: hypothetical protein KJN97_02010 [Deltaproteobacteria bacterium]|nr:hypothetical protein [Deltaproteobacteria bacterium]
MGEVNVQRFGCALALLAVFSLAATPRAAEAQGSTGVFEELRATPKGTIGLGLVGAELGLIIPSVSGLNNAWALSVFPIVGATGGALAGYFALDKPGRSKGSVAALVVGLAGVMPAILVTVKGVRKERQENWEPTPQIRVQSEKERRALETAEAGPGLLRLSRSGLRVAAPGFSFSRRALQDAETIRMGGLRDRTELRLSLASGVF